MYRLSDTDKRSSSVKILLRGDLIGSLNCLYPALNLRRSHENSKTPILDENFSLFTEQNVDLQSILEFKSNNDSKYSLQTKDIRYKDYGAIGSERCVKNNQSTSPNTIRAKSSSPKIKSKSEKITNKKDAKKETKKKAIKIKNKNNKLLTKTTIYQNSKYEKTQLNERNWSKIDGSGAKLSSHINEDSNSGNDKLDSNGNISWI